MAFRLLVGGRFMLAVLSAKGMQQGVHKNTKISEPSTQSDVKKLGGTFIVRVS
jgi:hypothetical protein